MQRSHLVDNECNVFSIPLYYAQLFGIKVITCEMEISVVDGSLYRPFGLAKDSITIAQVTMRIHAIVKKCKTILHGLH